MELSTWIIYWCCNVEFVFLQCPFPSYLLNAKQFCSRTNLNYYLYSFCFYVLLQYHQPKGMKDMLLIRSQSRISLTLIVHVRILHIFRVNTNSCNVCVTSSAIHSISAIAGITALFISCPRYIAQIIEAKHSSIIIGCVKSITGIFLHLLFSFVCLYIS